MLHINTDRLLSVLARTLSQKIIPNLQDAVAREEAESALGLIVGNILSQSENAATRRQRAMELSTDVLATLASAGGRSGDLDPSECARLLAALDEDQAAGARSKAVSSELFGAIAKPSADKFPAPTPQQLTACVQAQYPDDPDTHAEHCALMLGGNGKQTVQFDRVTGDGRVESLVMRRDIPDSFNRTTVVHEFPLLRSLFARGVPVPEPLWCDGSSSILPTAYLVTRKVPGKLAGDGKGAAENENLNPIQVMAEVLAQLHSLDPRAIDVPGISDQPWNEASLLNALDGWEKYYRDSVEVPVVAVDIGFAWLRNNVKQGLQPPAIVHGEAGFHNLLVAEGRLTALLDWELARLGSPVEDLCYVRDQIERSGSYADFIDVYVARGGQRPPESALKYYDIYRLTRNAGLFAAAVDSFNKGNSDKFRLTHLSSFAFHRLCKETG